ncbi:MAG: hypothetical protein ABI359_06025 [Ginsengibacter sp.]
MIIRKNLIVLILNLCTYNSFSQVNHINVLLGKTEQQVEHYFDSLGTHDGVYKITKGVESDGSLKLWCEFNPSDEEYYSCNSVYTTFIRDNGIEFCAIQTVFGSDEFAFRNLDYIKDNFEFVSDNKWTKEVVWSNGFKFKYVATFNLDSADNKFYIIDYHLGNEKP